MFMKYKHLFFFKETDCLRIMSKGVSKQTVDEETRDPNQDKRKGERGSRKCLENVLVSERKQKRLEEKERG